MLIIVKKCSIKCDLCGETYEKSLIEFQKENSAPQICPVCYYEMRYGRPVDA